MEDPNVCPSEKRSDSGGRKENTQVRYTGDWSSNSKLCSIANGYWEDPFLSFFNKVDPVPRRTSLICRGYYVRFRVCDYFVRSILEVAQEPIQIVSLGCGMDTTFFRILPQFEGKVLRFFELDFDSVIEMKKGAIRENEVLQVMQSDKLRLVSVDLRQTEALQDALTASGFDFQATTLFYSECVVNYLQPKKSQSILEWIVKNVPKSIWVAYEQCFSSDSFGKIMVKHFETNGCPLLSLPSQPNMLSQKEQLKSVGFQVHHVFNAWDAFLYLTRSEDFPFPKIPGKKQQFDEYEALLATCLHYSIRVGMNGDIPPVLSFLQDTESGISSMLHKPTSLPCETLKLETCELSTKLTGHSAVVNKDLMLIFGGLNENSHRCTSLEEVFLNEPANEKVELKCVRDDPRCFERVYSSVVYHRKTNSFYIFGGRKSPQTVCDNELIQISAKSPLVVKSLSFLGSDCPESRWRSSMVVVGDDLLIFGGKGNGQVYGDCWRFQFLLGSWSELKDGDLPSPRHSHSMCSVPKDKRAYLVGGILKDDCRPCEDSVYRFDLNDSGEGQWTGLPQLYCYGRRIGHSCAIIKDQLCVVGGYGADSSYNLDHFITLINLETCSVKVIGLSDSITFLPFGFSTTVHEEEDDGSYVMRIYGGGGNCFSFGTHLNNFMLKLKINDDDLLFN